MLHKTSAYLTKSLAKSLFFCIASVVAMLMLVAAAPSWAQDQKPEKVIMGLQNPPPVQFKGTGDLPSGDMQAKAITACTECHEARIILQQRLSKAAWAKEVDKMTKWGAVIDPADRDALIDYLSTNFSPDKPAYDAPRTLPDKSGKTAK